MEDYYKNIEYTNLRSPKSKDIRDLVREANDREYCGVCLCSQDLRVAKKYANKDLKLVTVVGFPPITHYSLVNAHPANNIWLGMYGKKSFSYIYDIIDEGIADELDVVFPFLMYYRKQPLRITKFLSGIKKRFKKPVKVIIELGTMFKDPKHIKVVCKILEDSGVSYLKSNTGLIKQDFRSLVKHIGMAKYITDMDVKASGGIKTKEQVIQLLAMGVKRIGTSGRI